jgi:hypothetical protein
MNTKSLTSVHIKDAEKGIVSAVISTFGVIDLDGDVTSKSSFTDGAPVVVSAYGHTSWDGTLPIGKGVLKTTDNEAVADLQFFLNTTHGRDAFETIKHLSESDLQEWSYSLENTVAKRGELDGKPARFIEATTVKEVSPVLRGASIGTRTLSVKSKDLKFSEHATSVLADVNELVERASEVVALRAEKGKTISEESADLLEQIDEALGRLKAAVIVPPPPSTPPEDELTREFLRFVATTQGVTTS